MLIGGGLALGHVMERSYLLQIMSSAVQVYPLEALALWFSGRGTLRLTDWSRVSQGVCNRLQKLSRASATHRQLPPRPLRRGIPRCLRQGSLAGAGLWVYMTAFAMLMAITANFISSTVAAIIILPVVAKALSYPTACRDAGASRGHQTTLRRHAMFCRWGRASGTGAA